MLRLYFGVTVICLFSLVGCAVLPVADELAEKLKGNYILVHEDGFPIDAEQPDGWRLMRKALNASQFRDRLDVILDGIDRRARDIAMANSNPPLRILVFVHGGMNGYRDDFERMKRLILADDKDENQQPSLFSQATYYPIFINWNSALGDSIADDLFFIRFGQRKPWWGIPTAPFVLLSRLVGSIVGAPIAWTHSLENYRDGWHGARAEGDGADDVIQDGLDVTAWFVPRLLTTPVLEAFGTPAWHIMKRRAQLAVASRLPGNEEVAPEGAARTLIKELEQRIRPSTGGAVWRTRDGTEVVAEITLVGHSMGAILLNRLLAAADNLPAKHIVYLAPATGIDEIDSFILPYLRRHLMAKFSWFSLGRRDEARESYLVAPRGTLLAWIDALFEPGWTVGQNTQGRATNVLTYYQPDIEPEEKQRHDGLWRGKLGFRELTEEERKKAPFDLERVSVYVARRTSDEAPRKHGDFDEPRFLGQVLCWIDADAFKDKDFCSEKLDKLPPRRKP